jgi:MarR-like DNA-binding transcriptional regulator SgrR of sgrS sRNA
MNNRIGVKFLLMLISLAFIFAIKPNYGGEIKIKLNEPDTLSYTSSNYSNMIFYSLIYENLFYMQSNGYVYSHLFSSYVYNTQLTRLQLQLKDNLCFSNGKPISGQNIKYSLEFFLNLNYYYSTKLRKVIKRISVSQNSINIELYYDYPDILSLLSAPELVLISGENQVFSGMYVPIEWVQKQYIKLAANKFYPGGRPYLDHIKVVFNEVELPDIFLSSPNAGRDNYTETESGVYQNVYIAFPKTKISQNTRVALYSLLKDFNEYKSLKSLQSLTADAESPVAIEIEKFSKHKIRTVLKSSKIKLYLLSSLNYLDNDLLAFFKENGIRIETVYLDNNELQNFLENIAIEFVILEKIFNKRQPTEEKIKKIIKEMTFQRMNVDYLKLINEMEEVKNFKNEEMFVTQLAKMIEKIISDGFILPLFQNDFSLYVKKDLAPITMDYYGRPVLLHCWKNPAN